MIDIPATLAPAAGVALRHSVAPPRADEPLWSSAVELQPVGSLKGLEGFQGYEDGSGPDNAGGADLPPSARFAGASGATRNDALLRGTGEAVERRALHPSAAHRARFGAAAELDRVTLHAYHPGHALAHPDAAAAAMPWYEAKDAATGAPVLVPADCVDWPARSTSAALFDPSPSGAAAGRTYESALGAAMVEVVERDAFTVAWGRQLRLPTYVPSPADTALEAVWQRAGAEGTVPFLARIPTAVPHLWCMAACLIDPEAPGALASVGMKATTDPAEAAVKAFQEAWQVRTALRALHRQEGDAGPVATVVTEHDRLAYMLTPAAYESVRDWVDGFRAPRPLPSAPAAELPVEELTRALAADGAAPLAVDLTRRLSPAVAAMGWHVVKVLAPGYQNLRMDETQDWSWHRPRLASAVARTGCAARVDDPRDTAPHPLP
ncbi:YcaO-like family protein [Streptomyces sp. NPDC088745]|uniref:YcaO-like family protein n=1 Tax=Streptomyces sp. NPDC088745 TaxID=3365884 RepID=UPI00382F6F1E